VQHEAGIPTQCASTANKHSFPLTHKAAAAHFISFIHWFCMRTLTHRKAFTNTMSTKPKFEMRGTTAAVKDAAFKDFPSLLLSYGLRLDRPGDVEEAQEILRAMSYGV
jgi:hypothetical protein